MGLFKRMGYLVILMSLGSCVNLKQPVEEIQYFTLEYPAPRIEGLKPVPALIQVEPFGAPPPYNSDRIVYRDGAFKRDAYYYYRWQASPNVLVDTFLRRDIGESGLFESVLKGPCEEAPSFRLKGTVDDFLEWDGPENWQVVLALRVTFIAEGNPCGGRKILMQKAYRVQRACMSKNARGVAEAMSLAMSEVSKRIILEMYESVGTFESQLSIKRETETRSGSR
jgi:ABC-type uncharacterized transport system auxiliary subunit